MSFGVAFDKSKKKRNIGFKKRKSLILEVDGMKTDVGKTKRKASVFF